MSNLGKYYNLSIEFAQRYAFNYFKSLFLPVVIGLFGGLFVFLTTINPAFGFIALFVSIPCVCFSFWKGYIATFALNCAALSFYKKQENRSFEDFVNLVNKKELASYLGFCAILSILFFIPSIIILSKSINFITLLTNPLSALSNPSVILLGLICIFITSILLIPFTNFLNQALFFKKNNESYFDLFLNCYKLLNLDGILLTIIFSVISSIISTFHPVLILFASLAFNLITFSMNTFWYHDRITKENN